MSKAGVQDMEFSVAIKVVYTSTLPDTERYLGYIKLEAHASYNFIL